MLNSSLLGLQYNYGSLSCNVLLNDLFIDYIRHVLITIRNCIFCETKQLIDRYHENISLIIIIIISQETDIPTNS